MLNLNKCLEEVNRVYSRFLTECVRYPWSKRNMDNRPVLIACPDWPVRKRYKQDQMKMLPSEGANWHGILLVPPRNRLNAGVKEHFETENRKAYVRVGLPLSRIHVEPISSISLALPPNTYCSHWRAADALLMNYWFSRSLRPSGRENKLIGVVDGGKQWQGTSIIKRLLARACIGKQNPGFSAKGPDFSPKGRILRSAVTTLTSLRTNTDKENSGIGADF